MSFERHPAAEQAVEVKLEVACFCGLAPSFFKRLARFAREFHEDRLPAVFPGKVEETYGFRILIPEDVLLRDRPQRRFHRAAILSDGGTKSRR